MSDATRTTLHGPQGRSGYTGYMLPDFDWLPTDSETYEYRLDALWPACDMRRNRMFLLGEPADHAGPGNAARYLPHMTDHDGYWVGSRPVTRSEFMNLPRR